MSACTQSLPFIPVRIGNGSGRCIKSKMKGGNQRVSCGFNSLIHRRRVIKSVCPSCSFAGSCFVFEISLAVLLPSLLSTGTADVYRCVPPHSAFPCAAKDSDSQGTAFHLASRGFTLVIVLGKNLNLFRLWAQSPVPQSK